MKWVTKNNLVFWIILGIFLLVSGIMMGTIQDKNTKNKEQKKKADMKESLVSKTNPSPLYEEVMPKLFNFLSQTYSDSEKMHMIKQISAFSDNQDPKYDTYNYIIRDTNMKDVNKIEAIKQRFALNYAIPTSSSPDPNVCMNKYLIPLKFSDPKIITIMGDTAQSISQKIGNIQSYLKTNNF